ncbi:MAG: hypothetical protein R3F59_22000 [Myxococcota bacterium]
MNAVASARRLLLAAGVALTVGIPILACSGAGETDGTTTDGTETPAEGNRLVGNWRMMPDDDQLRQLKIIGAAMSGKKEKKDRLGDLTKDEQQLFKEWEGKKGDEAKAMKQLIKFTKGCEFDFTEDQVTIHFGKDEQFGPVSYEIVSSDDANTTIKFDPGLGNGTETHSFDWESATKGVDHISSEQGKDFFPLNVQKR